MIQILNFQILKICIFNNQQLNLKSTFQNSSNLKERQELKEYDQVNS